MFQMEINGSGISAADFPRNLQGWVAFSMAFAMNTRCRDKAAFVELLLRDAEKIVAQCKTGEAPDYSKPYAMCASDAIDLIRELSESNTDAEFREAVKSIVTELSP